ncbi:protein-glutamine gamma-glutamyltransferase E-like [Pseudophryne corroboree]|uniref:protein-glutamine gamma-glutamyltransferase E-like n=1 Tax=Pseudophryne corroboree TaxID=495146 RepID=UPI0030813BB5
MDFFAYLNHNELNIEFTFENSTTSINFLDVTIYMENNSLHTRCYTKPTDSGIFLRADSCHHPNWISAIPGGQLRRIKRNCSIPQSYNEEASRMKNKFMASGYGETNLDKTMNIVGTLNREDLLVEKTKTPTKIANQDWAFITTFNSQYKTLERILNKHWGILRGDPIIGKRIPAKPKCIYRKAPNIGSKISLCITCFFIAALQITDYDLQVNANKKAHNCSAYMGNDLVVRRGQEILMTLTFNAALKAEDRVQFTASLVTSAGAGNSLLENTFTDSAMSSTNSWGAQRGSSNSTSVTFTLFTPNDAVIGRYALTVQTNGGGKRIGEFILLFNPWAPGDIVYLSDQAQREEYVLSEFGLIFIGEAGNPSSAPWNYGQFQERILYITFVLLDSSLSFRRNPSEDVRKRNNPLHVSRVLSAIVNSKDDTGVVQGNWSGDYSDGTNPSAWNGSTSILKSWYEKRQPVKYGQCWVFAGVLCTVSRALGLPCRLITNYNSAHDTDGNLSIERYYDVSGEPVEESDDSIWNFHCWNEGWFFRTDLGDAYSGWQIYDSTPQEMSDGIYQLGPTSQHAVKEGEVNKLYDTRFVFSEVNADVINTIVQKDGKKTKGDTERSTVGQLICTKAVGRDSYMDITQEYKYAEGTPKEREIYNKALQSIGRSTGFVAFSADAAPASAPRRELDVSGVISVSGTPEVGDDVNTILILKNLTSKKRSVTANISVAAVVYTRAVRRKIFKQSVTVHLGPNEGGGRGVPACLSCIQSKRKKTFVKEIPLKITYAQYEKALTTDNMIHMTAVCQVEDWGDLFVEANISLKNPPLITQVLGPTALGRPVAIEVRFTNPLPTAVSDCVLTVEGSGLTKEDVTKSFGVLEPAKMMNVKLDIVPYATGEKKLLINFTCNKFNDIKAFLAMNVAENS